MITLKRTRKKWELVVLEDGTPGLKYFYTDNGKVRDWSVAMYLIVPQGQIPPKELTIDIRVVEAANGPWCIWGGEDGSQYLGKDVREESEENVYIEHNKGAGGVPEGQSGLVEGLNIESVGEEDSGSTEGDRRGEEGPRGSSDIGRSNRRDSKDEEEVVWFP